MSLDQSLIVLNRLSKKYKDTEKEQHPAWFIGQQNWLVKNKQTHIN